MRRKLVAAILTLVLVLTATSALALPEVPEKYELPLVTDGSVKLTVYMAMEQGAETMMLTYDEHTAIQEWEKRTGIDFTFVHPPENDDGTYFNMIVASGEYPDIWVTGNWSAFYPGGVEGAIADGILLDLNPFIEKYGYHYLTEAHTNWDAQAQRNFMTDSGMYRFGAASQRVPVLGQQHTGMVVRSDVLDALGVEYDKIMTVDEVTEMLRAFKKHGFEVPLSLGDLDSSYFWGDSYLSAWAGVKAENFMLDENGKVTYSRLQPGFKEYLQLLSGWMAEGLIDRDFINRNHNEAEAMLTSGRAGMTAIGNWETQEDIALVQVNDPNAMLKGVTAPVRDEASLGVVNEFAEPIVNGTNTMYWGISSTCKYPEIAFRALDYLYSYEGTELMVFGVEKLEDGTDIHWTNPDGTRQFSDYILKNPDIAYNSIRRVYTIQNLSSEYASEMEYMQYGAESNAQCWAAWTRNATNARIIPTTISLTSEESTEFVTTMNEIETYIFDKCYSIICNDDSIDNWDGYVKELYNLGIERMIEIQQAAYDRYMAR